MCRRLKPAANKVSLLQDFYVYSPVFFYSAKIEKKMNNKYYAFLHYTLLHNINLFLFLLKKISLIMNPFSYGTILL
jgi:hypothetical protein